MSVIIVGMLSIFNNISFCLKNKAQDESCVCYRHIIVHIPPLLLVYVAPIPKRGTLKFSDSIHHEPSKGFEYLLFSKDQGLGFPEILYN